MKDDHLLLGVRAHQRGCEHVLAFDLMHVCMCVNDCMSVMSAQMPVLYKHTNTQIIRAYIHLLIIGLILEAFPLHTGHVHHVCRLQGLPKVLRLLLCITMMMMFITWNSVFESRTDWLDGRITDGRLF